MKNLLIQSCILLFWTYNLTSQSNTVIRVEPNTKHQIIDGFGAHQSDASINQQWFLDLFYQDIEASIYRVDLTPKLRAPYSDLSYNSPWFMGSSVKSVFNLEDPANPNGPENNRVRTYKDPADYTRVFGGRRAPIAVMKPNIDSNLQFFVYSANSVISEGIKRKSALGDFKLIGSIWSPLPWVKVSSGNLYPENWWPGPVINSPWPFIWGGNFAGGKLDVSNTPLAVFHDGVANTSSLTQFARSTAAYILGYQRFHKVNFYAISIQNELNFEVFYNSMTYPLSSQYITALKVIRAEFNKHPELQNIRIMGPEDLLGGDAYGMWEYGGPVHKNLQYLSNIANDPLASQAVDFFCVHGYANDGVTAAGSNPQQWNWWVNGWTTSPAAGIPANVKGFKSYNKKSWMTETSGENRDWIFPKTGFPGGGGLGIGIRIHQALVNGLESAWIYWTFSDSDDAGNVSDHGLTNQATAARSPKYVAAKHYFKFIRPNASRVNLVQTGNASVLSSAYYHDSTKANTIVLINTASTSQTVEITIPNSANQIFKSYTSRENSYWQESTFTIPSTNKISLTLTPYSMHTVTGKSNTTSFKNEEVALESVMSITPNPCNEYADIQFSLQENTNVQLQIANHLGQAVYTRLLQHLGTGNHSYQINTNEFPSGYYFLRLTNEKNRTLIASSILVKN